MAAGRLAPASEDLAVDLSSTENGSERELPAFQEPPRVPFICLDAPMLQEGELLPVSARAGEQQPSRMRAPTLNRKWLRHVMLLRYVEHLLLALLSTAAQCSSHALCVRSRMLMSTLPAKQVDELLEQRGVRLCGEGAADALTIRHPGLTLYPLDDECVDLAGPQLQVMAALLLQDGDEQSGSDDQPTGEGAA